MHLKNEFQPIRTWATIRDIYSSGSAEKQYIKLMEEAGELSKALLTQNKEEINDAIGDMVVVLTSIAHFNGTTIEDCINSAYNEIKDRTGSIKNGSFVKEV